MALGSPLTQSQCQSKQELAVGAPDLLNASGNGSLEPPTRRTGHTNYSNMATRSSPGHLRVRLGESQWLSHCNCKWLNGDPLKSLKSQSLQTSFVGQALSNSHVTFTRAGFTWQGVWTLSRDSVNVCAKSMLRPWHQHLIHATGCSCPLDAVKRLIEKRKDA